MTTVAFRKQIDKRTLLPVYLLHGEEDYLQERAIKELTSIALGNGDPSFNAHTFRGSEHASRDIIAAANSYPFLSEHRVVVVREAEKFRYDDVLSAYVREPLSETVLIMVTGKLAAASKRRAKTATENKDVFAYLQSTDNAYNLDVSVEFKPLRESSAVAWIREEFQASGVEITDRACELIVTMKGTSTRLLSTEMAKISTALHALPLIDAEDVHPLLGISKEGNVFTFVDLVLRRQKPEAFHLGEALFDSLEPMVLIALLQRNLLCLWQIKGYTFKGRPTDKDAREVGLSAAWQVENMRKLLSLYHDQAYFDRCFRALLDAETSVKSQPRNQYKTILTQLLARLTD